MEVNSNNWSTKKTKGDAKRGKESFQFFVLFFLLKMKYSIKVLIDSVHIVLTWHNIICRDVMPYVATRTLIYDRFDRTVQLN